MAKKLTLTIGIPAFNEEKNIKHLIKSILKQKTSNFVLKNIIVVSDGSTDNTNNEVKSIKSKKLKLVTGKKRLGKRLRINFLLRSFSSDVILLLDADITLENDSVLTKHVEKFLQNPKVMLVSSNSHPSKPSGFIEKAIYSTLIVYLHTRESLQSGNNIYGCTGACLGLRAEFAKNLTIPEITADDDYIYLECISKGYLFRYAKESKVSYKLPKTIRDYLRQAFRSTPQATKHDLGLLHQKQLLIEFSRPKKVILEGVVIALKANLIGTIYISLVKLLCIPFYSFFSKNYKLEWFSTKTTRT